MGFLPGIDQGIVLINLNIVTSSIILPKEDDQLEWKKQSLRKEREFLMKLKLINMVNSFILTNLFLPLKKR